MSYKMKKNLANKRNYGAKRSTSAIKYIFIHYTGNDGDSDESNARYFSNNYVEASAHYFVDDDSVTQSVPDNYVAWSVGGTRYSNCNITGGGKYYTLCTNSNSISIELCDTKRDGTIYPSKATIKNAIELTKKLMKKYHIPQDHVLRHFDRTGKACPAYWCGNETKNNLWKTEFYNKLSSNTTSKTPSASTTTPSSTSTSNHAKKKIVANGQKAANKFVGCNIVTDGIWGNKTKKAAIKVVQTALNKDYGAKLSVDGIWGSATDKAFGSHYVKVGERQWLVTALEILCALKGKDPKGIEYPGVFGQGLKKACGTSKAVKKTFKDLCS